MRPGRPRLSKWGLEMRKKITTSQIGVWERYMPDPKVVEVVKRLPKYLQLVVTLMAMIVPLIEESKMHRRGVEMHWLRPPA